MAKTAQNTQRTNTEKQTRRRRLSLGLVNITTGFAFHGDLTILHENIDRLDMNNPQELEILQDFAKDVAASMTPILESKMLEVLIRNSMARRAKAIYERIA